MRHSFYGWRTKSAVAFGAALLMLGASTVRIAAKEPADAPITPEVNDSGWAVSSEDKPTQTPRLAAAGPKLVSPKSTANDESTANNQTGDQAKAKQPAPALKWLPAKVASSGKKSSDKKPPTQQPPTQQPATRTPQQKPSQQPSAPQQTQPSEAATKKPSPAKRASEQTATPEKTTTEPATKEPAALPESASKLRKLRPIEPHASEPAKDSESAKDSAAFGSDEPSTSALPTGDSQGIIAPLPRTIAEPNRQLTRFQRSLRSRLRSVLSFYYRRPLNSVDHDPWEVMHHMLAYEQHSRLLDGGGRGRPMTAVGYLCFNRPCQGKQMMTLTADGVIETRVAVGLQGHKGQLMAMLAQCDVSPDYPIRVDGAKLTIRDLIRSEQLSCYAGEELTFKLIGLMHYLDNDATWVNDQGETWDFARLIREERTQKIRGAACGGTHRLSGLSLAVNKRRQLGRPVDGEYFEAERFLNNYVNYTFAWQNKDGSLSTEWFRGPGSDEDINRRVRTTGHLLEWLLYTIPDRQLHDPRVVRAVNYLTNLLSSNTSNPWEIGPLSHALHALMIYDRRMFQPHDAALVAAAEQSGQPSRLPKNLNYRNIDSRVVASLPSADDAEAARIEIANANSGGLRSIFGGGRRRGSKRSR